MRRGSETETENGRRRKTLVRKQAPNALSGRPQGACTMADRQANKRRRSWVQGWQGDLLSTERSGRKY